MPLPTPPEAALLDSMLDELPVGVCLQQADGRVRLMNRVMAELLGRPLPALLGQVPFELLGRSPSHAQRLRREFLQQFEAGGLRERELTVPDGIRVRTLVVNSRRVQLLGQTLMLSTAVDVTERKRVELDLTRRAFHDELTGLPHRGLMQEIVGAAVRQHQRGGHFALVVVDLDNFKQINDSYGHAVGDSLLKAVAGRIGQCIRGGDTLARLNGDEFLLLLDPLGDPEHLPPLLDRLLQALKQPFDIDGRQLLTSASLGASLFPLHGDSYDSLRRCADAAMGRAREGRRGSAAVFDEAMGRAIDRRMDTEQRLRTAVRERHFRAAFQPKVSLRSGQVVGFEALVRWVEPDGTVHAPGAFIALAGELGLLDELTRLMVDEVALHLPALQAHFGAQVSVSINVSARQAADAAFIQGLCDQLAVAGIARHVVIELTEDALLATQRFQQEALPQLREVGVRVSIDDFGTGYSSLATLADLTADEVKVDRAFITAIHERPRSQGILRAIESLCTALGIEVVAEGVETAQELAYLRQHTGIGLVQGYLFARPQFIEALLSLPPEGVTIGVC
ncbi:bifunctional diguanylate cyclase/phosphodiesterase [Aquincola sp. J276]|uniref:putative bifunctional diguanylate cyclase/phosphodiesterase n=1 Tax=Aquincola sp. J276 TaxID=2898432 RepID=UPI002150F3B6|nr:EAL domain-containing protein [Aquincola sp. J276]MCR5866530.1 EAL domain-containing protein [Aquincola sp. J276]